MPILNYGTKVKGDKFTAIMFNTIQNAINWIYDQLIALSNTVGNLLSDNIVNGDNASAVGYTANRINNIASGLSSRIDSVSLSASESSAKVDEFEARVPTAEEKAIWDSLADGMDIVLQVETSVSISPNVLNRWLSPVSSLTIDFSAGTIGKVNEYILEFKPASSSFTISLPSGVLWPEDPEWELGLTYQISVVNGLALYIAWDEEGNASGSGTPEGGGSGGGDINIIEAIKVNGTTIAPDARKAVNITVPTKLSDLDNDLPASNSFLLLEGGSDGVEIDLSAYTWQDIATAHTNGMLIALRWVGSIYIEDFYRETDPRVVRLLGCGYDRNVNMYIYIRPDASDGSLTTIVEGYPQTISNSVSGTFTSADGKTITVSGGQITAIS